jgi:hypothetical protein
MSRWMRFFTVFGSGSSWKKNRGGHARRLDEDTGIIFRIKDSHIAQPCEFRFIVRSNRVVIKGGGPETGGRRGVRLSITTS